jgi:uncharacterized protein
MDMTTLSLFILPGTFAVCRLPSDAPIPGWARGEFVSIARTHDELSIVCTQENVPAQTRCERDWRIVGIAGQLDFGLTGILASIAAPLAQARIPIFAVSTFDTDYILVRAHDLENAMNVLARAGHQIEKRDGTSQSV